jgi:hypothetical protein
MTSDNDPKEEHSFEKRPGGMGEQETLSRLTVEEKAQIAKPAIYEFPHVHFGQVAEWVESYGGEGRPLPAGDLEGAVDVLVGVLVEAVESGDNPEALDHFIYDHLYEAALAYHGIDPDEVAGRDPLPEWDGVYE